MGQFTYAKKYPQGTQMAQLRFEGRVGSRKDPFWNGVQHTCCGAKAFWYHKKGCPAAKDDDRDAQRPASLERLDT